MVTCDSVGANFGEGASFKHSTSIALLKVTVTGVLCFPVVLEQSHKYFFFCFFSL